MNEEEIRKEAEKTIGLLTNVPRVEPRPFFYTRLRARMARDAAPARGLARLLQHRLALAMTGIALLVALNAYSLLHLVTKSTEVQTQQAIASFVEEYNISTYQY